MPRIVLAEAEGFEPTTHGLVRCVEYDTTIRPAMPRVFLKLHQKQVRFSELICIQSVALTS